MMVPKLILYCNNNAVQKLCFVTYATAGLIKFEFLNFNSFLRVTGNSRGKGYKWGCIEHFDNNNYFYLLQNCI